MDGLAPLFQRIDVKPNGSILLGNFVNADGFAKKQVRVVTHAHLDHLGGLQKSHSYQGMILMTPETFVYASNLYNFKATKSKVKNMRYGNPIKIWSEKITFLKADHILGSVQVLVENEKGLRVLYSGDFKNPGWGTEIVEDVDILIVDATYGCPHMIRDYKDRQEEILVDVVERAMKYSEKVVIFSYYGKSEEVILILRRWGFDQPVIMERRHYNTLKELERLGYNFGEILPSDHPDTKRLDEGIFLVHLNRLNRRKEQLRKDTSNIILSGWFFEPYRRVAENAWEVGFSDHADFEDTIFYIIQNKPGLVITDASRSGKCAEALARYLKFRYGIKAVARPSQLSMLL